MNEHRILSRRVLLKTMAAAGAITAAQLKWWEEPLLRPLDGRTVACHFA